MRGWIIALVSALIMATLATPVSAEPGNRDHGGRGQDHGDAFRQPESGKESTKPDYDGARWSPAHKANYTNANRPKSDPINKVVIHTMQGSYKGTEAWFKNPDSEVSAHYIMSAKDAEITQMVHESDIGWHAGNWDVNVESIGIEHEGYVDNPGKWYTDKVYRASAKLVQSICERYDIPIDRDHIIAHSEVPGADHTDPGSGWDWSKYMKLVRSYDKASITIDNAQSDQIQASSSWGTAQADGNYGDDYAYTTPAMYSDPLWYEASIPRSGKYKLQAWYPKDENNNEQAPYLVNTANGYKTVYADQRNKGDGWVTLGEFELDEGSYPVAGVSRWTHGDGNIIADAVRLVEQ